MTENRCIEVLKKMKHMFTETCAKIDENTALDMAVEAIREIQQYRAIGTPTQIYEKIGGLDVELGKYHSIGTVEEFKAYKNGDCMNDCEYYDNCSDYIYSKGYNQGTIDRAEELQKCREYGYNKAIDDFAEQIRVHYALRQELGYVADTYENIIKNVFEYAEKLKGGGKDA